MVTIVYMYDLYVSGYEKRGTSSFFMFLRLFLSVKRWLSFFGYCCVLKLWSCFHTIRQNSNS